MLEKPLLLGTFATSAAGQVRVDTRLDTDAHLQGEPVTVVDILNTGDEAFAYSTCDGRVWDHLVEYELRRADRVEVEFKQGDVAVIVR